jgi:tetratricopeptide (TPR) repeat protein
VLFDLRGKRKRVVQVSYAALAVLFLVGFLGFGIGVGGGPGGILDALGITDSSSSGSGTAQFEEEIDAAQAKLAKNPNDTDALLKLADNEYLLGKEGVSQDPTTQQITITNDAHTHLGAAADAWSKYLRVNKGKPELDTAYNMVNVYVILNDADGAAKTQAIIAQEQPSAPAYGQLAYFQYAAGDIEGGDASREKALSMASGVQRKQLESTLNQQRKIGLKIKKAQQKAKQATKQGGPTTPGTNPLQNPFGATPVSP